MRRKSPSSKMRRLSERLVASSACNHCYPDLPPGTLPSASVSILHAAESDPSHQGQRTHSDPKPSTSDDDTFSTSSSAGDLLPNEIEEHPRTLAAAVDGVKQTPGRRSASATVMSNPLTLKVKTSGFLSSLKPQLTVDSNAEIRRFSFEAGDDADESLSAPGLENLPAAVRNRLLRKSASMSNLEARSSHVPAQEPPLPRVPQSPMIPHALGPQLSPFAHEDPMRLSKIPTPVYLGSLTRPRRERDDSSSSLLTAIRQSDRASCRSNSLSSSAFSSPSGSRIDMTQGWHGPDMVQVLTTRTSGSKRLLDHTNALRGNPSAPVLQVNDANSLTCSSDQHVAEGLEPGAVEHRSNYNREVVQADMHSHDGHLRKENGRPMRRHKRISQDESATNYAAGTPM
jgi:hypothetical protein